MAIQRFELDKATDLDKNKLPIQTVNGNSPDSNGNITVPIYSHPNSGVTAGTYNNVTVNAQGHVTAGSKTTFATVATSGSYNDLSNKPSIPATPNAYVVASGGSYSQWYRKWSNGAIEQGGYFNHTQGGGDGGYKTITFSVPFSNTNYCLSNWRTDNGSSDSRPGSISSRSASNFKVYGLNSNINHAWYACGY